MSKRITTIIIGLLFLGSLPLIAQSPKIDVAIGKGDVAGLMKHVQSSVELTVLNKEGTYSKNQAEIILRDFFNKNAPISMEIQHQGNSGAGGNYMIGLLKTATDTFNTYIILKKAGELFFIQEMRFELE